MNSAANFFKHADRDPDEILEIPDAKVNDFILLLAIDAYFDLGCELTLEMDAFSRWMTALHPDVLLAEQIAMEIRQALAGLAGLSRTEQLEVGRTFLQFWRVHRRK
jgi:hypothetical protein